MAANVTSLLQRSRLAILSEAETTSVDASTYGG